MPTARAFNYPASLPTIRNCFKVERVATNVRRQWIAGFGCVVVVMVTGVLLARPGTTPIGKYALSWYAVVFVLLAVAGRTYRWAAWSAMLLGAGAGVFLASHSVAFLVSGRDPFAWPYVVAGIAAAALSGLQFTRRRLDPVLLAAIQLGIGLVAYWIYNAVSGAGLNPDNYVPETLATPFRTELPLLGLALASAGLILQRSPVAALERLGITRPTWWQPFVALLAAAVLVGLSGFALNLAYWTTPNAYSAIGAVEYKTNETVLVGVVYALLAGISEEALFRGALQPRAGLVPTALLFAMIHIQYGLTAVLLFVFVAGLVFGALRSLFNTTTAIMAHTFVGLLMIVGLSQLAFQILVPTLVAALVLPLWRWWREGDDDHEDVQTDASMPDRVKS